MKKGDNAMNLSTHASAINLNTLGEICRLKRGQVKDF